MRKEIILVLLLSAIVISSITVLSLTPQTVSLYNGPTIGGLISAAYDPNNGLIYAVDSSHNDVVIFDPFNYSFIGTITVGAKPVYITYFNGYLYVVNQGSGTISVIDPSTNKVVKTIYVGGSPSEIALTKGGYIYVVNSNGTEVFNQNWQIIGTLLSGESVSSMVYDPNTGLVYVLWISQLGTTTVSAVNGTEIIQNVSFLLNAPFNLAVGEKHLYGFSSFALIRFNPYDLSSRTQFGLSGSSIQFPCIVTYVNGELYVYSDSKDALYTVNVSNGHVSEINLINGLPIITFAIIKAHDLLYDPKTGMLYIIAQPPNPVITVDVSKNVSLGIGTQISPQYVLFNNVTGKLYVADINSNVIYEMANGKVIGMIPTLSFPQLMTYNTRNGVLYVTDGTTLIAENPNNGSFLWKSTAGEYATALIYDSVNNLVYVADNSSDLILAISADNGSMVSAIQVQSPVALVVNPQNGLVYAADYDNKSITVINGTYVVSTIGLPFKPTVLAFSGGELYVGGLNESQYYIATVKGDKVISVLKVRSLPIQMDYYDGYLVVALYPVTTYNGLIEQPSELLVMKSNMIIAQVPLNNTFLLLPASMAVVNGTIYITQQEQTNEIYEIPLNEIIPTFTVTTNTSTTTTITATITSTMSTTSSTTNTQVATTTTTPATSVTSATSGTTFSSPTLLIGIVVLIVIIIAAVLALKKRM